MPKKVKPGEKRSEFIPRCISELTNNNEYSSPEQRAAVCFSMWRQHKKNANAEIFAEELIRILKDGTKQGS